MKQIYIYIVTTLVASRSYREARSSRNVAFKMARMSESVLERLESQDEVIVRKPEADEEGSDCDL